MRKLKVCLKLTEVVSHCNYFDWGLSNLRLRQVCLKINWKRIVLSEFLTDWGKFVFTSPMSCTKDLCRTEFHSCVTFISMNLLFAFNRMFVWILWSRQGCARVSLFQKLQFKICISHCIKTLLVVLTLFPCFFLEHFSWPIWKHYFAETGPIRNIRLLKENYSKLNCWAASVVKDWDNIATMDKQHDWMPSVCYPDLRSLRTKKISLFFIRLDSRREQKTLSSPCCLAEPYIAQTSPETAPGKCQAYWMQVITMFLRHCHPSLSRPTVCLELCLISKGK